MKKIFYTYLYLLVAFATMIAGCSKILDKKPIGEIDANEIDGNGSGVTLTAAESESLLNGAYNDMFWDGEEYWAFDRVVYGDALADNCYSGSDNANNHMIDLFTFNSLNTVITRNWSRLFSTIGKANEVIDKVAHVTDPALSAVRKSQILGEARTLRAASYFELVKLWGDVPLILKPIVTTNTETIFESVAIAKKDKNIVYDTIIADLEYALVNVRSVTAVPNKQYVHKGIVNLLLAKVYATRAPYNWDKVNQYCDAVMADGYALLPNYDFLWDGAHEFSTESIWEANYQGWGDGTWGNWIKDMYVGSDWQKFNTPSADLVRAFQAENDNIRMNSAIQFVDYSGKWVDPYWPMNNLPIINKIRGNDKTNYILYRLADILLLKAEALTEQNKLDNISGAQHYLNMVRNRVSLPNTTATSQATLRLAIEKERQLELAFEGQRWFDLVRTGRAMEVMKNARKVNNELLNYPIREFRLLLPIPQSELDRNPKLIQNPGY